MRTDGVYTIGAVQYPSVTTVLDPLSDFSWPMTAALKVEIANLRHLYHSGSVFEMRYVDPETGEQCVCDCDPADAALNPDWISGAGARMMKQASGRGRMAHDLFEAVLRGDDSLLGMDGGQQFDWLMGRVSASDPYYAIREETVPYLRSLTTWLQCHAHRLAAAHLEQIVMHPGTDDVPRYAGRCDFIGTVAGVPTILDLKTSGTFKRAYGAQVAAYYHCSKMVSDDGSTSPASWDEPHEGAILLCTPERCAVRVISHREMTEYYRRLFVPALLAWSANNSEAKGGCPVPTPESRSTLETKCPS